MLRTILVVFGCTAAGIALGYLFGMALDAVSPHFSDRLLGSPVVDGELVLTPGLNIAIGMANGGWMGFVAGVLAAIVDAFLRAKRIGAGKDAAPSGLGGNDRR